MIPFNKELKVKAPKEEPWQAQVTTAHSDGQLVGVIVWGEKDVNSACFVYRENIPRIIEELQRALQESSS